MALKYQSCSLSDLITDAKKEKQVDLLKELAQKKVKGKPITFLALKRLYFEEVHPDLIPVAKKKKQTFYEIIEEL